MTQLSEAISIITDVLQLKVEDLNNDMNEVKVSSLQSKAIQTEIMKKFGCSKQTAYYYYFYRGKKKMSKDHRIEFLTDRSAPKKKKTADDVVAEQLANLKKEGPASPFRL